MTATSLKWSNFTEDGADQKMMKRQSYDRVRQMLDFYQKTSAKWSSSVIMPTWASKKSQRLPIAASTLPWVECATAWSTFVKWWLKKRLPLTDLYFETLLYTNLNSIQNKGTDTLLRFDWKIRLYKILSFWPSLRHKIQELLARLKVGTEWRLIEAPLTKSGVFFIYFFDKLLCRIAAIRQNHWPCCNLWCGWAPFHRDWWWHIAVVGWHWKLSIWKVAHLSPTVTMFSLTPALVV